MDMWGKVVKGWKKFVKKKEKEWIRIGVKEK